VFRASGYGISGRRRNRPRIKFLKTTNVYKDGQRSEQMEDMPVYQDTPIDSMFYLARVMACKAEGKMK
jgi:hypothetical protein